MESRLGFPAAADMMKLAWDDELAYVAQAHANQCEFAHDCNQCRQVDSFSVGQNLFMTMSSAYDLTPNWTLAIQSFYDEISDAPTSLVSRFQSGLTPGKMYGHFSQVVWAQTWKVGCGFTAFKAKSSRFATETQYTCNYGPAGNFHSMPMYKAGRALSQCPGNTRPARDFPALCEAASDAGPKQPDVGSSVASLFNCDFEHMSSCGLKIQHANNAFLIPGKLFNYLSFRLKASQQVSFALPSTVHSSSGICVRLTYRKGPTDASLQGNNLLKLKYADSLSRSGESVMTGDTTSWMPSSVGLRWASDFALSFFFQVPSGAADQVLDVKQIRVTEGSC